MPPARPPWRKLWVKLQNSDIWDMHPVYLKTWIWLVLNADPDTGRLQFTLEHIADRVRWTENNKLLTPKRGRMAEVLNWFVGQNMAEKTTGGAGNRKYTALTIVNWGTYQSLGQEAQDGKGTTTGTRNTAPYNEQARGEVPEVLRTEPDTIVSGVSTPRRRRPKTPYQASAEAQKALQSWAKHRPLPDGIDPDEYHKILDDMHRIDKVSWNSATGIYAICRWAVTEWQQAYIQSPGKLRERSKGYPEMKTWQVIQGQVQASLEAPPPAERKPFSLEEVKRNMGRQ